MDCRSTGKRLREARAAARISQDELAQAVGVRAMTISRAERGKSMLRHRTLSAVAKRIDVSESWLLTGEGRGPDVVSNGAAA